MPIQATHLDRDYLDRKRQQLMLLQRHLRVRSDSAESEERDLQQSPASEVREYEDEAQRLDQLEREDNLAGSAIVRLARVQRALEKITEGTYGLSDVSGEPIPQDRLEAMPDAINTFAEQSRIETAE